MPRVHSGPPKGLQVPLADALATIVHTPSAHVLGLQQSIGNQGVTALLRARRLARQPVAPAKPIAPRVVQTGIKFVRPGQLAATLGLPPNIVPPGAESNPDFVRSLFAPDAAAYHLDELHGVPPDLINALPEGELVEVESETLHLPALTYTLAGGEGIEKSVGKAAKGGSELAEAVEHSTVFRAGGKLFLATSYAYAVARFVDAPLREKPKIVLEETGRIGGGALGATAGVAVKEAVAIYLKFDTGPAGLVVFGVLGALGGDKLGDVAAEKVAEGISFGVDAVRNLWNSPETIAQGAKLLAQILTKAAPAAGQFLSPPGRAILAAVMQAHERVAFENWDLRYLPAGLQADVRLVGAQLGRQLGPLEPDAFLARINQPLSAFGVPAAAAARIAAAASAARQPGGDPMAMRPLEFVALVHGLGLTFVQDPAFAGGWSGPWDDQRTLHVRLEPLVRERAEANPANWNISGAGNWRPGGVPGVTVGDRDIDLGGVIRSVGETAWARLGPLDQRRLPPELAKPLKALGVAPAQAADIAAGVNGMRGERVLSLDADAILESTPAQLVPLLQQFGVPVTYVQAPGVIAEMAIRWVQAGFQPW